MDAEQAARYAEADAIRRRYGNPDNPYRGALDLEAAVGDSPPDPETLRVLAADAYRGVGTAELLVEREYRERELGRARAVYDGGDLSAFEWVLFSEFWLASLGHELERRRRLDALVSHPARARFSPETLEAIKERLPLPELIGRSVPLKKAGAGRWEGHCPFHADPGPSFSVWEDGHYYCFGCQVTGDHYEWVRAHDHCAFPEAVRRVAELAGVDPRPAMPRVVIEL